MGPLIMGREGKGREERGGKGRGGKGRDIAFNFLLINNPNT